MFYKNQYEQKKFNNNVESIWLRNGCQMEPEQEFLAITPAESEFQSSFADEKKINSKVIIGYFNETNIRKLFRMCGEEYARLLINIKISAFFELDGHFILKSHKLLNDYSGFINVYTPPNKTLGDFFKKDQEVFLEIKTDFFLEKGEEIGKLNPNFDRENEQTNFFEKLPEISDENSEIFSKIKKNFMTCLNDFQNKFNYNFATY